MIKIGLLGHCHYTRVALIHMLQTLYQDQLQGGVHITLLHELNASTQRKVTQLDCVIVIGEQLLSFGYSQDILLKALCHHPGRIVVLAEKQMTPLITHFLSLYCQRFYFIPLGQSITGIQKGLHGALITRNLPWMKAVNISSRLTAREYQVLNALFSGMPVADLCTKFMLSEKTLSTHKVRALEKLQCRNRNASHHALLAAALQAS